MLRYAREDTHYLLYVYDLLRKKLISKGSDVSGVDPYIEVCKHSQAICWQLYEKELFTEASHLQLYQSSEKKLQPAQLAVFSALYSWRDCIARKEDESTGYVLPKHLLFHLAEDMPASMLKLHAIIEGTHSLVGKYAANVLDIIRQAKVQIMNSRIPHSTLSNEHEMQPEMFKEEASGITKCMDKMQSSPQHLMENGKSKSASIVKDLVLSRKMNKMDSKNGETMLGESIRPLKIGSGPALVHRATSSTLFKRKTKTDGPLVDSSLSREPSAIGVQSQQLRIFGGASNPTSSKKLELRIPTEIQVSSLPNIPQQKEGFSNDAFRPQTIARNPLFIPEDLKKGPNFTRSTSHLSSGSAFYEAGCCDNSAIETSSGLKGGIHGVTNNDVCSGKALFSAVIEEKISDKQVELPMLRRSYSRPSGHLGQMLGGFGRRAQYSNSAREDKEETDAKLKAEQIKASVALPFHPFSGPIEGHSDRKAEKGSELFIGVLGAERCETLPQFANTLESLKESEREEHLEEFISLEIRETSALGEGQPQPDAYNGTSPTNSSLAEQFHSNSGERIKHRAWWPCVKIDYWMS